MSNYNFSVTLDGLNNINANDIDTDNIVTDYLTVNKNSSVPLVTPYTTNSNQIASCAFVQDAFTNNLANYVTLNTVQTITANKTFTGTITKNNTTFDYSDYRFVSVQGGGESTQIYQVAGGMTITSISNNKFISINTKDISGNAVNGLVCGFGNQAYLQGALNNRIDITGTQATIGGTSVPKITTQPITSSNTNEIASTAYVKTNLLDYVTLSTNQTITGNKTFNGNMTLNNLFVSNYVDLTLTTYENQFYGDIYGYRGVVCQNGFYVKSSPGAGATTYALIDSTGNISSSSTISASGNISTTSNLSGASISTVGNVTANQLLIRDPANNSPSSISQTGNTLYIAAVSDNVSPQTTLTLATRSTTGAYSEILKGNTTNLILGNNSNNINIQSPNLNISSTNITTSGTSTTTITGGLLNINNSITTFNENVTFNQSTSFNNLLTFYDGSNATQFDQNGTNLTVYTTGGGIKLGSGFNDNIVCSTNRAYLQGSVGNTIDMNGTQATIGGTSVPKITTQPASGSNTNEIATTQWSKTQLSGYAVLNGNNTFNGSNLFTNTLANIPIAIKTTTPLVGNTAGYHYVATGIGQYNAMVQPNDYVIFGGDSSGAVTPSNLVLTTWSATKVGIRITEGSILLEGETISQYAPYNAGYNGLGTTLPLKSNYDLGYIFTIPGSSFTGTGWSTAITPYNIMTINWNGFGNYTLGVWQCDIVITTNSNTSIISGIVWNTIGTTNFAVNTTSAWEDALAVFSGGGCQMLRLSFVLNVRNLTTTYYLNFQKTGGGGLSANLGASQIQFTRIA